MPAKTYDELSEASKRRIGLINRRTRQLQDSVYNLFQNAIRFQWESAFINESLGKLRDESTYKKLPQQDQRRIDGFVDAMRMVLERQHITHSYECKDGKRRIMGEYAMPSAHASNSLIENTCALVYRAEPHKVYFLQ